NDVPEQSLIGHVPVLDRTLEVGQVLFGCTYRGRVVLDQQVDDPVGFLHLDGTDLFRPVGAQAPAFDHRPPTHADGGVGGGDDHVAAAQEYGVTRKTTPGGHPHRAYVSAQASHLGERGDIHGGSRVGIDVSGAATTTFGEQHDREPPPIRDLQHAVGLAMVHDALGAGHHGVVVGHHHAVGVVGVQVGVDPTDPGDHAVRGGVGGQVLLGAATVLGGYGHRPVLGGTSTVAQVGVVLPGGAATEPVALGHGFGAAFIGAERMAFEHVGQVGAHMVQVDTALEGGGLLLGLVRGQPQQKIPLGDGGTDEGVDLTDRAGHRCGQHVFHLHGLEDDQAGTGPNPVAGCCLDGHDGGGKRCGESVGGDVFGCGGRSLGGQEFGQMIVDEGGGGLPGAEIGVAKDRTQEGDVVVGPDH